MTGSRRPFDDIRRALDPVPHEDRDEQSPTVRLDPNRAERTGIPEVILAGPKPLAEIVAALSRQAELTGRAIASRCSAEIIAALRSGLEPRFQVEVHLEAHAVVVCGAGRIVPATGGRIAVICAGTSDRPAAAEAALIAREMGVAVDEIYDVGVAGLHRLIEPLERVMATGVDAIVVAAGMDGALPSVVAGLVPVPVIGLPTSVGYGFGGQGIGALTAMLQSCAPGLVVVNIDNGIGAGAGAALIANRVARARS
ncbi:MAG: nickel pincer cofactor biosynthesis protein LarB [Chloroflexota bacterium]|nr:nickel pincer cofactor biosynthesis protein LarB [Chloroflexota bacterium]